MNNVPQPPKKPKAALSREVHLFDHLSIQEKINFSRHLAMVVKAGLPVYNGLSIIREQATSSTLKRVIDQLIQDVENGSFLADSLERFRSLFGDFFINIVRVGEASGTLSQNLLYLSDELKKSKQLQNKIRSAMVYPLVILFATTGLVSFLAFFIFPKLLGVFTGLHVQLPFTTRMVIGAVQFLREDGLWLLLGVIAAAVAYKLLMRFVYFFRYGMHGLLLNIPVVGGLAIALNTANFARILGLLLKSGVKIVEAVTITAHTFENEVYRKTVGAATEQIRSGGELADYLAAHSRLFPGLLAGMVRVGDNTGNLEENLEYLAEYYNEEIETKLQNLTSLLEPFLLLFMGGLVGLVAISIILPIYQLSSSVH